MLAEREKVFGLDHGQPLDGGEKKYVRNQIEAYNEANKRDGQHVGPITRTYTKVAEAILFGFHNTKSGRCFPSYESIAQAAKCARSTVHKAIHALEKAGILTWYNRLAHMRLTDNSRRVIRTSNFYIFHLAKRISTAILGKSSKSKNRSGTSNQDSLSIRRPSWRPRNEETRDVSTVRLSPYDNAQEQLRQLSRAAHLTPLEAVQVAGRSSPAATSRFGQVRGKWAASLEPVITNPSNASSDAAKQESLRRIRALRFAEPQGCW